MKVLGHRVLIRREKTLDTYKGLIYIPERSRQRPQEGVVVAVGDGVTGVKPGDRVLFGRYAGVDVRIKTDDCTLVWEADLMGVFGADEP